MDPAAKSAPSNRGGLGLRLRTYSAARYALRPMRNAAIPALTRGWFSTPARRRLVDAARTSPPAISAVIRLRTGAVGRALVPGLRARVLGRVRTFGSGEGAIVACLDVSGPIVTGGADSPEEAGLVSGRGGAGFGRTGGRVGGSEESGLSAGRAGAGLGGAISVFTDASGGFGLATRGAAGGRGTSETGGLTSWMNSSTLSRTVLPGAVAVAGGRLGLSTAATGLGSFVSRRGPPQTSHSSSSGSLSAPQMGQRRKSRMSSSMSSTIGSVSNSAAHRGHVVSPDATKPPQFVQMIQGFLAVEPEGSAEPDDGLVDDKGPAVRALRLVRRHWLRADGTQDPGLLPGHRRDSTRPADHKPAVPVVRVDSRPSAFLSSAPAFAHHRWPRTWISWSHS